MKQIKKGSIVVRKSHQKDVLFKVTRIVKTNNDYIALLRGIIERVEADSPVDDLEIVETRVVKDEFDKLNKKIDEKVAKSLASRASNKKNSSGEPYKIAIVSKNRSIQEKVITGKILHLDGDKTYSSKSYYYYKKLGLNAVVKNVPEYKQPKLVYSLLKIYNPDILIITRSWWYD